LNGLALDEALERAGVLDDLVAAEHVACSVDEGLTVLTGDLLADVVGVLFEQLLVLEHERILSRRVRSAARVEGAPRRHEAHDDDYMIYFNLA